jgi:hypothetical protein
VDSVEKSKKSKKVKKNIGKMLKNFFFRVQLKKDRREIEKLKMDGQRRKKNVFNSKKTFCVKRCFKFE